MCCVHGGRCCGRGCHGPQRTRSWVRHRLRRPRSWPKLRPRQTRSWPRHRRRRRRSWSVLRPRRKRSWRRLRPRRTRSWPWHQLRWPCWQSNQIIGCRHGTGRKQRRSWRTHLRLGPWRAMIVVALLARRPPAGLGSSHRPHIGRRHRRHRTATDDERLDEPLVGALRRPFVGALGPPLGARTICAPVVAALPRPVVGVFRRPVIDAFPRPVGGVSRRLVVGAFQRPIVAALQRPVVGVFWRPVGGVSWRLVVRAFQRPIVAAFQRPFPANRGGHDGLRHRRGSGRVEPPVVRRPAVALSDRGASGAAPHAAAHLRGPAHPAH